MKNNYSCSHKAALLALLLALLTAAIPTAEAQEYIKEISGTDCSYSIVREYNTNTRIVYNNGSTSTIGGEFLMVTETGVTTVLLTLGDDIAVSDFEISNDTVYFCGTSYLNYTRACLGFFSLTSFPTTMVSAFFSTKFFSFGKLEVLNSVYGGPKHLIMTGETMYHAHCLIDLPMPAYGAWTFHYVFDEDYYTFDDVAATDQYVAATARKTSGSKKGKVYVFDHPAPNGIIFNGAARYVNVDSSITSSMLLENEGNNLFDIAYRTTRSNQPYIIIDNFSAVFPGFMEVAIPANCSTHYPVEIKYNNSKSETDVLSLMTTSTDTASIIYHCGFNYFPYLYANQFNDQLITSIDYLTTDPGNFFAAGKGNNGWLWVYKYSPSNNKPVCSFIIEPEFISSPKKSMWKEIQLQTYNADDDLSPVIRGMEEKPIEIKCYYDLKDEISNP